jgi:hypothetical protein
LALPAVGAAVTFGPGNRVTINIGEVDGTATRVRVFWGGSPIYEGAPDVDSQHAIGGSYFGGRLTELRVELTYPEGTFNYSRMLHAVPDTAGSYTLRRS